MTFLDKLLDKLLFQKTYKELQRRYALYQTEELCYVMEKLKDYPHIQIKFKSDSFLHKTLYRYKFNTIEVKKNTIWLTSPEFCITEPTVTLFAIKGGINLILSKQIYT